jgi:hypothetical protein
MQIHAQKVFTQPILIVLTILLVLVALGASHVIEAQTAASRCSSTTSRSPSVTGTTLPMPGMINAKIDCAALATHDFSRFQIKS